MSNVFNQEPQAFGSITFKTTFGDIEVELFTKQCPKVTRNFLQLCLDGYYNDTFFERVEKDFIAIGGAKLEDEDEDKYTLPDEFHSRLRFTRRGLLATANTEKNANGPKFFFTLGSAPELQNKHTIFGRVVGDSVYVLVDLNECPVDEDLKPIGDKKIIEVLVKENPIEGLEPRIRSTEIAKAEDSSSDYDDPIIKPKKNSRHSKKLSFYDDDDSESEPEIVTSSKSDTELIVARGSSPISERDIEKNDLKPDDCDNSSNSTDDNKPAEFDDKLNSREKRLQEIRMQIKKIKQQIEEESPSAKASERRKQNELSSNKQESSLESISDHTIDSNDDKLRISNKKSRSRERDTLELIDKFKKKLKDASKAPKKSTELPSDILDIQLNNIDREMLDEMAKLDKIDDDEWLSHEFVSNDNVVLAKDASTKGDDWYTIDDPRRGRSSKHDSKDEYKRDRKSRHHHDRNSHHRSHHRSGAHRRKTSGERSRSSK